MEILITSSSIESGIKCWDFNSGSELRHYRSCASPSHGLACLGGRYLASSQVKTSSSSSNTPIFYWSWNKPQPDVKSFPDDTIIPLISNHDGTYVVGGGSSGNIYLWEVHSGILLKKWRGHYRAVTCLAFSDDESLLISGAEDGSVRSWSLYWMLDDTNMASKQHLYEHSFSGHVLPVTDIVCGYGGCNAIIVTGSMDHSCKIWKLSSGKLLRSIAFPSGIGALALHPGENKIYAGCINSKIYIATVHSENVLNSLDGTHIIGVLDDHSNKAITCLAFSVDGITLVSGSDDGMVRVWDTKNCDLLRVFRHAKGSISNILIIRQPTCFDFHVSGNVSVPRKRASSSLPPLDKYSGDADCEKSNVTVLQNSFNDQWAKQYYSSDVMKDQIKELQQQGSTASVESQLENLKMNCKKSLQMTQQWRKLCQDMHESYVRKLLEDDY